MTPLDIAIDRAWQYVRDAEDRARNGGDRISAREDAKLAFSRVIWEAVMISHVPAEKHHSRMREQTALIMKLLEMRIALRKLAHDYPDGEPCFCQMAVGNPMVSGHSESCRELRRLLK